MAVALDEMVSRLESSAPAKDGVPANYAEVVQEAVAKLGQDLPLRRSVAVAVVAGQATYELPEDFLRLVQLTPLAATDGVIITDVLTPVGMAGRRERVIAEGETLRIDPTPAYNAVRMLEYEAGYTFANGAFQGLTQNGARLALLYARHTALSQQAGVAAGKAWKFRIGDEEVDRSKTGDAMAAQAQQALQQYEREVAGLRRGAGVRSQYGDADLAAWWS